MPVETQKTVFVWLCDKCGIRSCSHEQLPGTWLKLEDRYFCPVCADPARHAFTPFDPEKMMLREANASAIASEQAARNECNRLRTERTVYRIALERIESLTNQPHHAEAWTRLSKIREILINALTPH